MPQKLPWEPVSMDFGDWVEKYYGLGTPTQTMG
jgi:hypothetical protein